MKSAAGLEELGRVFGFVCWTYCLWPKRKFKGYFHVGVDGYMAYSKEAWVDLNLGGYKAVVSPRNQ